MFARREIEINTAGDPVPGLPNIYDLHGIFTRSGRRSTRTLHPHLQGVANVHNVYTGWTSPIGAWLGNQRRAVALVDRFRSPYILMGHSNGSAQIARAVDHLAQDAEAEMPIGIILLNPALDRRWVPPEHIWMIVYYNGGDWPVNIARPLDWPGIRRINRWGGMGATGPAYQAGHVRAFDTGAEGDFGHSAVAANSDYWGPHLCARIRENLDRQPHVRML